ncbi:putative exported protein [Chlamydia psittaci VS225]|nr:putative exported protein [Chlamydia psittaci VS225]
MVVVFSIIVVLTILGIVLVGSNVLTSSIALICFSSAITAVCLIGLVLVFILNAEQRIFPKIALPSEMEFSDDEQTFLQTLLNLTVPEEVQETEIQTLSVGTPERVFITGTLYRNNPSYRDNISERVENLHVSFMNFAMTFTNAIMHCGRESGNLIKGIVREINDLFIPSLRSRNQETSLCYCLQMWSELLKQHSFVDFIVLILEKPEINNFLLKKFIDVAESWNTNHGNTTYISRALQTFNLWLYGLYVGEPCIEILEGYNSQLLTSQDRAYLEEGNFIQLIFSRAEPELRVRFADFLNTSVHALAARKCHTIQNSMNSDEYTQNDPSLRELIDNLNLRMTFCLNLPICSSWKFRFALARNLKGIYDLNQFIMENYYSLLANPFLLIELLHSHSKYQSFIQGLLTKAMPIGYWKSLIEPIIAGLFSVGIANERELSVMANHLGLSFNDLISVISSNRFLEVLFPHLFTE